MSATTSSPYTSSTATSGSNFNQNQSNSSKPLLFFVALGFGVVFTNLWIIVGVKYCFRYNRRARQGLIDAETGEPIDLANLPRPRRRREKKLMTQDEVNERFPLIKYKLWRASREDQGLPSAGGVTAPPTRPSSIKEVPIAEQAQGDVQHNNLVTHIGNTSGAGKQSTAIDTHDFSTGTSTRKSNDISRTTVEAGTAPGISEKTPHTETQNPRRDDLDAEEDDADPILTAIPTEYDAPGDACAICIDNLDDDDEVRGLTCGHAFHAACLDPWLTGRRACCPLCKADYFIPKPRAEGEGEVPGRHGIPLQVPQQVWVGGRGAIVFRPGHVDRFGFPIHERVGGMYAPNGSVNAAPGSTRGLRLPFLGRFSRRRNQVVDPNATPTTTPPPADAPVTPAQLESGLQTVPGPRVV